MRRALGTHVIIEMYGCNEDALKNKDFVEWVFMEAARKGKMKVVVSYFHQFSPYGVSGVVIVEESHLSIHTWPELGYAAVDFFYCSDEEEVDVEAALETLKEYLQPERITHFETKRGFLSDIEKWQKNKKQGVSV